MEEMTRLFPKCQGSTLTQTVGAAVFKFTNAKLFVFSTSTSWERKERWDVMTVRLFPWPLLPTQPPYWRLTTVPRLCLQDVHGYPGTSHAADQQDSYTKHGGWRANSACPCRRRHPLGVGRKENSVITKVSPVAGGGGLAGMLACRFRHNIPMLHTLQPRRLAHKGTLRPTGANEGDVSHLLVTIII